jgi:hypothetical protein
MDFLLFKNSIFFLQNVNGVENLTFHLVNIYFIFLITFFLLFEKRLLINLLISFLKNIKMIFIFIYFYFSGASSCLPKSQYDKKYSNISKTKKKNLKYSLKKNSFFLKTLLNLKISKKTLIRQKRIKKYNLKDSKLPDFFYKSWWDILITGKKTFRTPFLLKKEFSIFRKNVRNKEKILYKLYTEYNLHYRKKIENNFYKHFENLNQFSKISINSSFNKKINNFKKNIFLYKKLYNKNILLNKINTSIKLQFKNIKDIVKEKHRKIFPFAWVREHIFKTQKFIYNSMFKKKVKHEIKWINPNDPIMRNNIISFIKFHSIRFYLGFLFYFGPILRPLESFYYSYKYPLWTIILCIIFLYMYNTQFQNFIKKHDTKKIPLLKKNYTLDDKYIFVHSLYFFLVYLWYFTINETLSIQMLYLTALIFFSAKIFIYYRYQKNPSKYK